MSDELDLRTEEQTPPATAADDAVIERHELPPPTVRTVEADRKPAAHEAPFKKSLVREYFESAVVTLIMALFGMTFIVQAVKVPTGSMKNTIVIQDHLLVNKFIFGPNDYLRLPIFPQRAIRRGDVIVFKFPKDPQTNFVKRVIGLPGETIEYKQGKVFINSEELPEHQVYVKSQAPEDLKDLEITKDPGPHQGAQWTVYLYEDEHSVATTFNNENGDYAVHQPFKIPVKGEPLPEEIKNNPELARIYDADNDGRYDSDQYFCMGDNRDNSLDSRFWGTVPRDQVVGHAMFVYWSIDRSTDAGSFLTRTRWSRTGKLIK
ncbi:MAG TPA: signal peptidase I [Blastocatellia bacterium]|nr:signal peptidase I [Blastocatellia bacterium]